MVAPGILAFLIKPMSICHIKYIYIQATKHLYSIEYATAGNVILSELRRDIHSWFFGLPDQAFLRQGHEKLYLTRFREWKVFGWKRPGGSVKGRIDPRKLYLSVPIEHMPRHESASIVGHRSKYLQAIVWLDY